MECIERWSLIGVGGKGFFEDVADAETVRPHLMTSWQGTANLRVGRKVTFSDSGLLGDQQEFESRSRLRRSSKGLSIY